VTSSSLSSGAGDASGVKSSLTPTNISYCIYKD
jgi:hypothetical protein